MIPVYTLGNRPHQKPGPENHHSVTIGNPYKGRGELTITWNPHSPDFTISHSLGLTSFAGFGTNTRLVQRRDQPYIFTFDSSAGVAFTPGTESPFPDRPFIIEEHSRLFATALRIQNELIKQVLDKAEDDGSLTKKTRIKIDDRIARIRQFGAFGSSEAYSLDKHWTQYPPERHAHPHIESLAKRFRSHSEQF